jgi:LPXTG-site transpeptidase (sortase) family protein
VSDALSPERTDSPIVAPERPVWMIEPPSDPQQPAPASATPPAARPSTAALSPARRAVLRAGRGATIVGALALLLLVYEFLLSGIPYGRTQAALLSTFKQQVPTTLLGAPTAPVVEGTPVALLTIPRIGATDVVVEGSTPTDLKAGPGHLRNTPLPGEFGNSVIEGRRTTYGSPFGQLGLLRKGDVINVATGQGAVVYKVTTVGYVKEGQTDPITSTADSRLTLLTSDPAFVATGRLAVTAALSGKPLAVPTRAAVAAGATDLGLAGDPLGLGIGLIFLNLLCAAAWMAWRVRHRLPSSVIYLFAAPVMLTLALLAFASLDTLLPGTM